MQCRFILVKTDKNGNSPIVNINNTSYFVPESFLLYQNYPNPFNPVTTITYTIPISGMVKLKIYDITGKEILQFVNEIKEAGRYQNIFDGSNLSSGVYFYKIESGSYVQTRKMFLVK